MASPGDPFPVGKRVQAARLLNGMKTRAELADRLQLKGLSAANLGNVERGTRPVGRHEVRAIAEATGLPFAFFMVDFRDLDAPTLEDDRLADITARLANVERIVAARTPALAELLEEQLRLEAQRKRGTGGANPAPGAAEGPA